MTSKQRHLLKCHFPFVSFPVKIDQTKNVAVTNPTFLAEALLLQGVKQNKDFTVLEFYFIN